MYVVLVIGICSYLQYCSQVVHLRVEGPQFLLLRLLVVEEGL